MYMNAIFDILYGNTNYSGLRVKFGQHYMDETRKQDWTLQTGTALNSL